MGFHYTKGISRSALRAVFYCLSQVDSETPGARNTRTDGVVGHENRVQAAQNEWSRASRTIEWSGTRQGQQQQQWMHANWSGTIPADPVTPHDPMFSYFITDLYPFTPLHLYTLTPLHLDTLTP